jgi:hypothetical protein
MPLLSATSFDVTHLAHTVAALSVSDFLVCAYSTSFCLYGAREALRAQLAHCLVRLNRFGLIFISMAFVSLSMPSAAAGVALMLAMTKLRLSAAAVRATSAGLLAIGLPEIALLWQKIMLIVPAGVHGIILGIPTIPRHAACPRLRIVDGAAECHCHKVSLAA